jgi:hypothetical protein
LLQERDKEEIFSMMRLQYCSAEEYERIAKLSWNLSREDTKPLKRGIASDSRRDASNYKPRTIVQLQLTSDRHEQAGIESWMLLLRKRHSPDVMQLDIVCSPAIHAHLCTILQMNSQAVPSMLAKSMEGGSKRMRRCLDCYLFLKSPICQDVISESTLCDVQSSSASDRALIQT